MVNILAATHASSSGSDGWTKAAVIVAIATALFVAWQAWESRRATDGARRALLASQAMAIDSARARMDQDAPGVEVSLDGGWLPYTYDDEAGGFKKLDHTGQFRADASELLTLRVRLRVVNLRPDHLAHLTFDGPVIGPVNKSLLMPGEIPLEFEATFTLARQPGWSAHDSCSRWQHQVPGRS